ncbi:adenylate/guanylate cyclase domain-containing protein [Alphaproteobacteria bacterium]|nr:adenylate/guanylate cyclase domain-containing protein [Alphaproteobacteria bacterium]
MTFFINNLKLIKFKNFLDKNKNQDEFVLKRKTYGLRSAIMIFFIFAFLTLLVSVVSPIHTEELARKVFTINNIISATAAGILFVLLNEKNYKKVFITTILILGLNMVLGIVSNRLNFEIPNSQGLFNDLHWGRYVDYLVLLPLVIVVLSALLMRPIITLIVILLAFLYIALTTYSLFAEYDLYFVDDLNKMDERSAVYKWWFINSILSFIIISGSSFLLSIQTNAIIRDASQEERMNNALGRYFSPEIRDEIKNIEMAFDEETGKEQQVAILFTDIKGFTEISEHLKPEEVVSLLSEYQKRMIKAVFENKGTVDKFIGDAVMATFGTPRSRGNDAQNALDCARDMQVALRQWNKERQENSEKDIQHRISINIGPAIVGNIGSDERVEYTVIGDTVNVASRILEQCKSLKKDVLISEDVYRRLDEKIEAESFEGLSVRGRDETIKVRSIVL